MFFSDRRRRSGSAPPCLPLDLSVLVDGWGGADAQPSRLSGTRRAGPVRYELNHGPAAVVSSTVELAYYVVCRTCARSQPLRHRVPSCGTRYASGPRSWACAQRARPLRETRAAGHAPRPRDARAAQRAACRVSSRSLAASSWCCVALRPVADDRQASAPVVRSSARRVWGGWGRDLTAPSASRHPYWSAALVAIAISLPCRASPRRHPDARPDPSVRFLGCGRDDRRALSRAQQPPAPRRAATGWPSCCSPAWRCFGLSSFAATPRRTSM